MWDNGIRFNARYGIHVWCVQWTTAFSWRLTQSERKQESISNSVFRIGKFCLTRFKLIYSKNIEFPNKHWNIYSLFVIFVQKSIRRAWYCFGYDIGFIWIVNLKQLHFSQRNAIRFHRWLDFWNLLSNHSYHILGSNIFFKWHDKQTSNLNSVGYSISISIKLWMQSNPEGMRFSIDKQTENGMERKSREKKRERKWESIMLSSKLSTKGINKHGKLFLLENPAQKVDACLLCHGLCVSVNSFPLNILCCCRHTGWNCMH